MVTPQTKQQKNGLVACAVIILVLGGAIMTTGFIFEFHETYDKITDNKLASVHHIMFPHTQYWLGLPLFLLSFYISITRFYSSSILHLIGVLLCCFFMVASLCAVGLQGVVWYVSLDLANIVRSLQCQDIYVDLKGSYDSKPRCSCKFRDANMDKDEIMLSLMTCSEVENFPAIVSALIILSLFAFLACQATCFVYVKILRWLEPVHYDDNMAVPETSHRVLVNEQSI